MSNKIKKLKIPRSLLKTAGIPLLSCTATFLLFLLMNCFWNLFPCGQNSIVWCDMEQQAVPLLMQFRELVQSGESLFYSPLGAGGIHFYAIFCFFLSNPLSLLILVTDIPADQLVTLLVFIKLAMASGTAAFWFRYRIKEISVPMQLLLSMMYGCSGYGLFYYQNLMWLDIMVLVPLLIFSLRRMLKKANPLPYLLVISAMMLLCFYLGYMIVLFVVLYMAVSIRTTVPEERRGAIALRFILASMLAACLTAFVWLPCFIQVMQSARGTGLLTTLRRIPLFNHFGDKFCVLGCTCLGFAALIPLWQKQTPRISSRRRDRRIFLLLAAAVIFDPINAMWHAGSYQGFPLRWGMIPILLMLTLAGKQLSAAYTEKEAAVFPKKAAVGLLCGMLALMAAGWVFLYLREDEYLHSYVKTLWLSKENVLRLLLWFFLATVGYSFVILFRQHRILSEKVCMIFLVLMFAGEFVMNYRCYVGAAANPDTLYTQTVSAADKIHPEDPTARIRMTKKYAHANMIGAIGYPTLAHYTSLTREDFLKTVKRLGYSSYWMEVTSTGGTMLSDALWNIQYLLGKSGDFPSWTETVWTGESLSVAESSLKSPAVRYLDADAADTPDLPEGSRIALQKQLADRLAPDLLTEYQPAVLQNVTLAENEAGETVCTRKDQRKDGFIRYSIFVKDRQALYFDLYSMTGTEIYNPLNGAAAVEYNSRTIEESYPENNNNGFLLLGEPEQQYITVTITVKKDFVCESFGVFGITEAPLKDALAAVEGTDLQYHDGVYSAVCITDEPAVAAFSAAYDEGFSAEINGCPAEVCRVEGCQLGVKVPKGKSEIVLRYHVPALLPALFAGIAALILAVPLWIFRRKLPEKLRIYAGNAAKYLLQAGYGMIVLFVYIMPLCIWLFEYISKFAA